MYVYHGTLIQLASWTTGTEKAILHQNFFL